MVRLVIKLHDANKKETFVGSERDAEDRLRVLFPHETQHAGRLLSCVEAVNKEGFAEVEVEPYKPTHEAHMLPQDYDTRPAPEDPWPRQGD